MLSRDEHKESFITLEPDLSLTVVRLILILRFVMQQVIYDKLKFRIIKTGNDQSCNLTKAMKSPV